jgi:hypothetical protein
MSTGEDILELIDRYFADNLTESEKDSFHLRLAQDAEFKTLVENQKLANDLILGDRLYSLKLMMDEDFSSGKVKRNQKSLNKGKLFLFGGLALITSAVRVYLMLGDEAVKQNNTTIDSVNIDFLQIPDVKSSGTNSEAITTSVISKKIEGDSKKLNDVAKQAEPELIEAPAFADAFISVDNEPTIIAKDNQDKTELLPQVVEIRCAVKTIQAKVKSEPACMEKEDGRLIVGKTLPYVNPLIYGISSTVGDTLWQSSNIFSNLPSGNYAIYVKDANRCLMLVKDMVEIENKECRKVQQTYSFNPTYGETVTIKADGDGIITIRNRAGVVVFSGNVSSGEDFIWDGQTLSGGISTPGLYIYSLEHRNGHSVRGEILIY